MNYKQLKEENERLKKKTKYQQSLLMLGLSMNTSKAEQIEYLLTALHEIKDTTNDNLTIWVAKNAIEKHNINILIHKRNLEND